MGVPCTSRGRRFRRPPKDEPWGNGGNAKKTNETQKGAYTESPIRYIMLTTRWILSHSGTLL